jgi:hypothetical protein
MSFGIVMAQLYIFTLLSGSFHYDEDGTNILCPIKGGGNATANMFYGIADCSHPVLTGIV